MQITQSQVILRSSYHAQQSETVSVELHIERLQPDKVNPRRAPSAPPANAAGVEQNPSQADLPVDASGYEMLLLKLLIEMMSGREIKLIRLHIDPEAAELGEPGSVQPLEWAPVSGVRLTVSEHYSESESLDFDAIGRVSTADGRVAEFDFDLLMQRQYNASARIEISTGTRKDPLIINLAPGTAQLSHEKYDFDLDADGSTESISMPTGRSAFIALDRNADGVINDGSELFGTRSGNGFIELKQFDEDGNGYIDGGDAIFERLLAYSRGADGVERLQSLQSLKVGALYLGHVAGRYDLRNNDNEILGQIRSNGIYLNEDLTPGSLQQVDLVI